MHLRPATPPYPPSKKTQPPNQTKKNTSTIEMDLASPTISQFLDSPNENT